MKANFKNTPGVGSYEVSNTVSSPQYSFQKNQKKNTISIHNAEIDLNTLSSTPGPGRYNSTKVDLKKKTPSYTIGGKLKDLNVNMNPGPGQYDNSFSLSAKLKSTNPTMSKSNRDIEFNSTSHNKNMLSTPGPGRYNVTKAYNYNSPTKTVKISNTKREINKVTNFNPGPGEYINSNDDISPKKHGYSISKSNRFNYKENEVTASLPGPGRYTSKSVDKKIAYSFSKNTNYGNDNRNPGPGQYDINKNAILSKQPGWKMSTTKRVDLNLNTSTTPGPGRYKNKDSLFNSKNKLSGNVVFGKDSKYAKNNNTTPGPGQYKIPCSIRDVNEYSTINGKFNPDFKYV